MRKAVLAVVFAALAVLALAPQLVAQAPAAGQKAAAKPPEPMKLKVGDTAPDFTLLAYDGAGPPKAVSLHDYKGKKNVALAFYVFAFTSGWTKEMKAFQENIQKLEAADTQVLGVSIDSPFANHAFAVQTGVSFPLLADQSGKAIEEYGLLKDIEVGGVKMKTARRATFLIDKDGKIVEESVDNEAVDPSKIVAACERKKLAQ